VLTFGDWPLQTQLKFEAQIRGIELPNSLFENHLNVLTVHYGQSDARPASSVKDLLDAYELKE
jgi:hypothetical protein